MKWLKKVWKAIDLGWHPLVQLFFWVALAEIGLIGGLLVDYALTLAGR